MAKKNYVEEYRTEYKQWLNVLEQYHTNRFDKNYRAYTNHTNTKSTKSLITDPVAPELVERVVQKLFERDPKFNAESRGKNLPMEVKAVVAGVVNYFWTAPEAIQVSGTMRSRLKKIGREFCVVGNAAVEVFYNPKSKMPDMRVIAIEDVIFDPSKTLKTSDKYYVRQWVDLKYLKENVELVSKGGKKETGIFNAKAIKQLEEMVKDSTDIKDKDTSKTVNRSGSSTFNEKSGRFQLISRWEGKKCCRFIYDQDLDSPEPLQEFENNVLEEDPYDFVMDIEVPKQPYAFSMLDFLSGITDAKDMFLNQIIDYGSKVLNPPLFVDPSLAPVNRATLGNAWRVGGLVFANPQQAEHKMMPPLGNFGFDMLGYLQQRSESVSGIGAYTGGVPNQVSDQTQGTKGGIQALIAQGQSSIVDRQVNIEESIIEPVVNKWIKMAGTLMSPKEVKWVMIGGENSKWVGITKGLLTGKVKLQDLMTAGLVEDNETEDIVAEMMFQGKDPESDVMFDTDWVIRVETGSLAEANTEKEIRGLRENALLAQQMGVKVDTEKLWKEIARKSGMKDPGQYILEQPEAVEQATEAGELNQIANPEQENGGLGPIPGAQGGGGLPTVESPRARVAQEQTIGQGPTPNGVI